MINFNALEKYAKRYYLKNFERPLKNNHISIILHKKSIIAIGSNNYKKTHPFTEKNNYRSIYIHSEIAAFMAMDRSFIVNNCQLTLVNFRFLMDGALALSKPCEFCSNWIGNYFEDIYYSDEFGKFINFKKENENV